MSTFVNAALAVLGAAAGLALLVLGMALYYRIRVWREARRRDANTYVTQAEAEAFFADTNKAQPSVAALRDAETSLVNAGVIEPKLTDMTRDELAKHLIQKSLELDMAIRVASMKGVRLNVDLVDQRNGAHPKGRPQVRVQAHTTTGEVLAWPT